MNENIFRVLAAVILFTGVGISTYFRRKADQETGEQVSRRVDGNAMMAVIRIFGLLLWFSPLIYLLNPGWMSWSKIGLPEWMRWLGVLRAQDKTRLASLDRLLPSPLRPVYLSVLAWMAAGRLT